MSNDKRVRNPITNPEVFVVADGTSAEANLGYSNVEQVKSRLNISSIEIKDINSAQYTLLLSDNGKTLQITNTSPTTITLPNNFPVGYNVRITSLTTSSVTFSATGDAQLIGSNTLQGVSTFYVSQIQNNNSVYRQISSGQILSAGNSSLVVDSPIDNNDIEVVSAVAIKLDAEKYRVILAFTRQNTLGQNFVDFEVIIGVTKTSGIVSFNNEQSHVFVELAVITGRILGDRFIYVRSPRNRFNTFSSTFSDNDENVLYATPSLVRHIETDSGSVPYTFTIHRRGKETGQTNVNWSIIPANIQGFNNATVSDFGTSNDFPSGTVSFNTTETEKQITVNVLGNTVADGNRAFRVQLSNPSVNNIIANLLPIGLIIDNNVSFADTIAPSPISYTLFGATNPTDWIYRMSFVTHAGQTYCVTASTTPSVVNAYFVNTPIFINISNVTQPTPVFLSRIASAFMVSVIAEFNSTASIPFIDIVSIINNIIKIRLFHSIGIVIIDYDITTNTFSNETFFSFQQMSLSLFGTWNYGTTLGYRRSGYLHIGDSVVKADNGVIVAQFPPNICFNLSGISNYDLRQVAGRQYHLGFSVIGTTCYAFDGRSGSWPNSIVTLVDLININTNSLIGSISNPSQMAHPIAEISPNLLLCRTINQLRLIRINSDLSINVESSYNLFWSDIFGFGLVTYGNNSIFYILGTEVYVIKIVLVNDSRVFQITGRIILSSDTTQIARGVIFGNFLYLATNLGIHRIDISSYT